uniref:SKI/DACH domain containing 1 n=1 Tax=Erpetoichthys calabaricus TaxID=27687 RepID=A0A8C4X5P2_ERPCA
PGGAQEAEGNKFDRFPRSQVHSDFQGGRRGAVYFLQDGAGASEQKEGGTTTAERLFKGAAPPEPTEEFLERKQSLAQPARQSPASLAAGGRALDPLPLPSSTSHLQRIVRPCLSAATQGAPRLRLRGGSAPRPLCSVPPRTLAFPERVRPDRGCRLHRVSAPAGRQAAQKALVGSGGAGPRLLLLPKSVTGAAFQLQHDGFYEGYSSDSDSSSDSDFGSSLSSSSEDDESPSESSEFTSNPDSSSESDSSSASSRVSAHSIRFRRAAFAGGVHGQPGAHHGAPAPPGRGLQGAVKQREREWSPRCPPVICYSGAAALRRPAAPSPEPKPSPAEAQQRAPGAASKCPRAGGSHCAQHNETIAGAKPSVAPLAGNLKKELISASLWRTPEFPNVKAENEETSPEAGQGQANLLQRVKIKVEECDLDLDYHRPEGARECKADDRKPPSSSSSSPPPPPAARSDGDDFKDTLIPGGDGPTVSTCTESPTTSHNQDLECTLLDPPGSEDGDCEDGARLRKNCKTLALGKRSALDTCPAKVPAKAERSPRSAAKGDFYEGTLEDVCTASSKRKRVASGVAPAPRRPFNFMANFPSPPSLVIGVDGDLRPAYSLNSVKDLQPPHRAHPVWKWQLGGSAVPLPPSHRFRKFNV